MKIVIASGKGGTGKSMISSSLSLLFSQEFLTVACDCDVDAPNLGLWLGVERYEKKEVVSINEKASILQAKCDNCGKCYEFCPIGAIGRKNGKYYVNPLVCEGCGVCQIVCPRNAVLLEKTPTGEIRETNTKWGFTLVSGQVYPGETGSGKMVQQLRQRAEEHSYEVMILDSAAGIGCPVIASITGCDFAVLVAEPTQTSISDLHRILHIINHFNIPYGVVINKYDLDLNFSRSLEEEFRQKILGKIPYDTHVIDSIVNLRPVVVSECKATDALKKLYGSLKKILVIHQNGSIP